MKKLLSFLTLLFIAITMKAELPVLQDFPEYRIPNFVTVEEMQSLIGKTYFYYPSFSKYSSINDDSFLTGMFGDNPANVIILSVEGKTKKNKEFNKMTITASVESIDDLKGKKTKSTRQFIYYSGSYSNSYKTFKNEFTYNELRLMDYDKWKSANSDVIGKEFSDSIVKHKYKVVDVELKNDFDAITIKQRLKRYLVLKSGLDNSTHEYEESEAAERCFFEDKSGQYHTYLAKVEKPSNPAVKFGKTKTVTSDDKKGVTKFSYVDNFIDILIFSTGKEFNFLLKNVSQSTQKLIWDEAVYVDYNGSSSKVMHNGVKYSQKDASQPASTIIKGASIDELACPTSNVFYSESAKEWTTNSMYPNSSKTNDTKQVQLMLPIQIKDITNEYIFVFDYKYEFDHPERIKLPTVLLQNRSPER